MFSERPLYMIMGQYYSRMDQVKFVKDNLEKICLIRQICLSRSYSIKFFKGCLPQILLGHLNTLPHMFLGLRVEILSLLAIVATDYSTNSPA